MTCGDLLELIEPIASGDRAMDAAMREHIESCPRCASELASARRIEMWLSSRPVAPAPARFTAGVLDRIRRERWRAEQHVDRLFNLAIVASLVLVAVGVLAVLNVGSVLALAAAGWDVASGLTVVAARRAAPSLDTYVAAVALLLSALGMWWWADRTVSM